MSHNQGEEGVLGRQVGYPEKYDPAQLVAIDRDQGRAELGLGELPFQGEDIWNAYELSWLNGRGKPQVAFGVFRVRASSPCMVESKSLKLYLNSLNHSRFDDMEQVRVTIERDLSQCAGEPVLVTLYEPERWASVMVPCQPAGNCLDELDVQIEHYLPAPELLACDPENVVEEQLYSHLLRSRCPVTGQPDWATVQVDYRGPRIEPHGLLAYLISYRNNDEFHEQCVERIFCDVSERCQPERLTVSARYLRRGGLDINPVRSNQAPTVENQRLIRQ